MNWTYCWGCKGEFTEQIRISATVVDDLGFGKRYLWESLFLKKTLSFFVCEKEVLAISVLVHVVFICVVHIMLSGTAAEQYLETEFILR